MCCATSAKLSIVFICRAETGHCHCPLIRDWNYASQRTERAACELAAEWPEPTGHWQLLTSRNQTGMNELCLACFRMCVWLSEQCVFANWNHSQCTVGGLVLLYGISHPLRPAVGWHESFTNFQELWVNKVKLGPAHRPQNLMTHTFICSLFTKFTHKPTNIYTKKITYCSI